MSPDARPEFVLETADAAPQIAALSSRFSLVDGERRTVRRSWLDTFDWRLHDAGLVLEHLIGENVSDLLLHTADGERLRQPATMTWPAHPEALPPGPIRDLLAEVAAERALLVLAEIGSDLHDVRVLNGDEKTVVRLTIDRATVVSPIEAELAPRLAVVPVRGYAAQAGRVANALAEAPGIAPADSPQVEAVLAAAGRRPGDYTGKVDVTLSASMPAPAAVATILLHLLDTAEVNLDGTLADVDTEFLHDLRVAVRRTRSAVKLAGSVLPDGLADRFGPEFKWLGDLTTPTRDLDVYLLGFDDLAAGLEAADPADLRPFRTYLGRQRGLERRKLLRGLRSARFTALRRDWRAALTEVLDSPEETGESAGQLASSRLRKAYRRVVKRGVAITTESPGEELHDLRKRCKELRYLLEFFASLADPAEHKKVVKTLKAFQDCLGEFQDGEVQRDTIRGYASMMMTEGTAPAATLLAMGELAARLDAQQRRARAEFAGRFDRFMKTRSRARMEHLIQAVAG